MEEPDNDRVPPPNRRCLPPSSTALRDKAVERRTVQRYHDRGAGALAASGLVRVSTS